MKTRLLAVLAVLPAALLISADDPKNEAIRAEMKRLEGTWKETSLTVNGKKVSDSDIAGTRLTFKADGTWVMTDGKETWHGTFTVDPTTKPKQGNFKILSGKFKDMTTLDIYEVDGDTTRTCYVVVPTGKESAKERPTKFASDPGSGHVLSVMKRVPAK